MKCNETVTISLSRYNDLLKEIESRKVDNIELVKRTEEVLSKSFTHTIIKSKEYDTLGFYYIHTNKEKIKLQEIRIENPTEELGRLKKVKQTSILWGLIKFNKN